MSLDKAHDYEWVMAFMHRQLGAWFIGEEPQAQLSMNEIERLARHLASNFIMAVQGVNDG